MTIDVRKDKQGAITGYRVRCCVGRDAERKQVWRTHFIERLEGLTPAKERKEVERLAAQWEAEQKAEYERTLTKTDRSKLTLSEFVRDVWWTQHVLDGSHKPTSVSFYKHLSDTILTYKPLAEKQLSKISAADVKAYIVFLQTKAVAKDGSTLSKTTIVRVYQTLRNILHFAIRFGYIQNDPCQNLSVKDKPAPDHKGIDFLEPQEAQRFMQALEEEPLFWRTMETILITCGLRRGEAIGLRWGDIDPDKLTLTVQRNITIDANAPEKYSVGTPKSGQSRVVPIPQRVLAMLRDLKAEQETRNGAAVLPNAYIFSRLENPYMPIYPSAPTRWQSRFVKRHGLKNVSPHDLRHSFAALSLEAGANIKQIQQVLGHKDVSTTLGFYAGISQEAERRAVEGVDALLNTKQA